MNCNMLIVKDKKLCESCGEKDAIVYCDGCDRPVCEDCRKFDLWSYGCGNMITKVFCISCYDDIEINPWGGERPQ